MRAASAGSRRRSSWSTTAPPTARGEHARPGCASPARAACSHAARTRARAPRCARGFAARHGRRRDRPGRRSRVRPRRLPALLQPILDGKADVVYGSRFLGGRPHRVLYFWHSLGNQLLTLLSNMLTNLNLTDMETCYKVFRREVLQRDHDRGGPLRLRAGDHGQGRPAALPRSTRSASSYCGRTYEEGKKISWRDGVARALVHRQVLLAHARLTVGYRRRSRRGARRVGDPRRRCGSVSRGWRVSRIASTWVRPSRPRCPCAASPPVCPKWNRLPGAKGVSTRWNLRCEQPSSERPRFGGRPRMGVKQPAGFDAKLFLTKVGHRAIGVPLPQEAGDLRPG